MVVVLFSLSEVIRLWIALVQFNKKELLIIFKVSWVLQLGVLVLIGHFVEEKT